MKDLRRGFINRTAVLWPVGHIMGSCPERYSFNGCKRYNSGLYSFFSVFLYLEHLWMYVMDRKMNTLIISFKFNCVNIFIGKSSDLSPCYQKILPFFLSFSLSFCDHHRYRLRTDRYQPVAIPVVDEARSPPPPLTRMGGGGGGLLIFWKCFTK